MVGEMPVKRSAQLILLLYLDKRRRPEVRIHGRPRSDRREDSSSRLWRPARALGTHAKQGPPTGHSAAGLRLAAKCLLTPRPHFTAHHARLVTRWLLLRTALLFVRSAVRLVYAERIARVGTPKVKATWQPNEIRIEVSTAPRKPEGWQGYLNQKVKEFGVHAVYNYSGVDRDGIISFAASEDLERVVKLIDIVLVYTNDSCEADVLRGDSAARQRTA